MYVGDNTTVEFLILAGESPPAHFSTLLTFNTSREGIIQPIRDIHRI
jgi:hypothetical protein